MLRHRVRLHGGDVPHGDQEPGRGHLLPRGQDRRHHQSAPRPPQGDSQHDEDDDSSDDDHRDQVYWLPAPVFIMGVVATVAGALAIFFPETLGETLPETMEDALNIGSGSTRGFCTFTCFDVREHYGEELKTVPSNGITNKAAVVKE